VRQAHRLARESASQARQLQVWDCGWYASSHPTVKISCGEWSVADGLFGASGRAARGRPAVAV